MQVYSTQPLDKLLTEAAEKAARFEWADAAERYSRALKESSTTLVDYEKKRILDLAARSWFKSAFQSEDRTEFKKRMSEAVEHFKEASLRQDSGHTEGSARMADAMSLFARFWLSDDITQRRSIINESLKSALESYHTLEIDEDYPAIGRAFRDLAAIIEQAQSLATAYESRRALYNSVAQLPFKTIQLLEEHGETDSLVNALSSSIRILLALNYSVLEPAEYFLEAKNVYHLKKKLEINARKLGSADALRQTSEVAGIVASILDENFPEAQKHFEETLELAKATRDSELIGNAASELVYASSWAGWREEDGEKRRELFRKGLLAAPLAIRCFQISLQTNIIHSVHTFYAECYSQLGIFVETDPAKKRDLLIKALEVAGMGQPFEDWGWLGNLVSHSISKANFFLAIGTADRDEKLRLLNASLRMRERNVETWRRNAPHSRDMGVALNYLALVKAELSKLELDSRTRLDLLRAADSHMEECVRHMEKWCEQPASMRLAAYYSETHGDILLTLNQLTEDKNDATRAIQAYTGAVKWLTRAGLFAPIPTLTWKTAKVQDLLRNYRDAATSFHNAAQSFAAVSKKVPNGPSIFGDLTYYMDAWAFIEEARLHHMDEEFAAASQSYDRARNVLHATKTWNHLSSFYAASSRLEEAEALSRSEKPKESIEAFRRTEENFTDAKSRLERRLSSNPDPGEREELLQWLDAADRRGKYCVARMNLEEAFLLDRKDEKTESLRKYLTAAELFRSLIPKTSTRGRRELETLSLLCQAWAKMRGAEKGFSAPSYLDAARLFVEAENTSASPRLKPVALANAEICRALAAATELSQSTRIQAYATVKSSLENAYDHYQRAGFKKTAEWTRATQRFFDALSYLWEAEVEIDPTVKAEFYHLAQKQLELAGRLYAQAGFPAKEAETRKHLKRAREQKELLLSPSEIFSDNPIASRVSMTFPSLVRDRPLGLERFEGANVKGRILLPTQTLTKGTEFTVELEMTNVGKNVATLVRLDNLRVEGLQIKGDGVTGAGEVNTLDMKGYRLDSLKTHKVQIAMEAHRSGIYDLSPRIVSSNDRTGEVTFAFDSASLIVHEATPAKENLPRSVEQMLARDPQTPITWFESQRSRGVFQCLAKDFAIDYMTKGLHEESSGWRSLMQLIREASVPRSSLYGPDGRDGAVLAELDRRGLIERRIFLGERGRGGAVERVRVAYDNPVVKMIVKQAIVDAF